MNRNTQSLFFPGHLRRKFSGKMIISLLIISIIVVYDYLEFMNSPNVRNHLFIHILSITAFFVYTMILIRTIALKNIKREKLFTKEIQLKEQLFYNKTLQSIVDKYSRQNHNIKNFIASLVGYAAIDNREDLLALISGYEKTNAKLSTFNESMLLKIKNPGLLGLLSLKYDEAIKNNIEIQIVANCVFEAVAMNTYEFNEIFGILIDNSIDAAIESEEKKVKIDITDNDMHQRLSIINSYQAIPHIKKIFERGYSTKGQNRGIGLSIVQEIIMQYDNIHLNTYIRNNMFVQDLVIEKQ